MFHMNLGNDELNAMLLAFGREIAAERVRRGWTQADLAHAASEIATDRKPLSTVQVGKIERGERGQLHEILQVALALDVELAPIARAADDAREAQ